MVPNVKKKGKIYFRVLMSGCRETRLRGVIYKGATRQCPAEGMCILSKYYESQPVLGILQPELKLPCCGR